MDINGYFAPANSGANPLSLYTLVPCRVLDTRKTLGLFNGTIPVGVVGSLCGVPSVALGFVFNATVVPPGPMGFLTLWPEGETQPVVSTLNALDGAITSNMAIVPTTNGSINAYAQNNTQLLLDISSYFAPIAAVNVLTATLPDGTVGQPYNVSLVADGGVAPYTWTQTAGSLPPGMNPLSSAGVISGTPTSTGHYSFTVKATDAQSNSATANLSITVNASAGTLAITTTSSTGRHDKHPVQRPAGGQRGNHPPHLEPRFGRASGGLEPEQQYRLDFRHTGHWRTRGLHRQGYRRTE